MKKYGLVIFILNYSCSYQPEEEGLCKLECSNSIISGNDSPYEIQLKSLQHSTTCSPDSAGRAIGPYQVQFLVGQQVKKSEEVTDFVPTPNISIEPLVIGVRPNINSDNDKDDRYRGIITPRSQWCSDSCGIVTLSLASVCPPSGLDNDLTIQIHSGALYSEGAVFPITTKDP